MLRLVLVAVLALGIGQAVAQVQRVVPQSRPDTIFSFAPVVKRVTPAVVNVYASRTETRPANPLLDDPFFQQFFGSVPNGRTTQSLGSGVIVDRSGLVVTNHHVIEGMTDVKVALADKREFEASIVLNDPNSDLAVLKIEGGSDDFPVLELGDSDALEVGDLVLAIGNPFAVGQTVTQGIISALARTEQVGTSDTGFYIQTDAAINPGNSGGALVDMEGRLVGINSAIYSRSGGSMGIGFAIPVNMVKVVVAAAKSGVTRVQRPWLGATFQAVSQDIADSLAMNRPTGALVTEVADDSPAAKAGLKRGDVVTAVDGVDVDDPEAFSYRIGTKPIGGTAMLGLLRSGKSLALVVKLITAPETPPRDPVKITGTSPFAGATLVNLSPAVEEELSIAGNHEGVVVADVADNTPAAEVGLQKGDIVRAINDVKITSTRDMPRATAGRRSYWKLEIDRGGQVITQVVGG
jgi:Do/DeqQ family serine protease